MTRSEFLSGRLREVFIDGQWIAHTNFKDQIRSIGWEQAVQKVDGLNSIAALVFHINYYLAGILHAFESGKLEISDRFSFDVPLIASEMEWDMLARDFLGNAETFILKVAQMDESQFGHPFFDERYGTYERNIEGVIEHSYYHLGQISLIRKMLTQRR